jgi:hypothetical protein
MINNCSFEFGFSNFELHSFFEFRASDFTRHCFGRKIPVAYQMPLPPSRMS